MSDRILTSNITGAINFPFTKVSLDFLQDAYLSEINALAKSKIDNYQINTVYRLDGFQVTLAASVYTWTEGTLFYNNEIFFIDAGTIAQGVGEVLILNIATTYLGTDPVAFRPSGSGSFNVHQTKSFVATSGTTGTGVFDADNVIGITKSKKIEIGTWDMNAISGVVLFIDIPVDKILNIECIISGNAGTTGKRKLEYSSASFSSNQPSGGVYFEENTPTSTRVELDATSGTVFTTSASYAGTSNRGFIYVEYEI